MLRGIWGATAQEADDLAHLQPAAKVCKNTGMLGIKGMEDEGMAEALRGEWKRQLAREGKLRPGAQSLRELVEDASRQSS